MMCHAAIFLDYENLYLSLKGRYQDHDVLFMNIVEAVVREIEKKHNATAVLRKVYAPFDGNYSGLADELSLNGFQSIHVLNDPHKNSADLMLAVDAIETVYTRPKIDVFCIIGGDRDFIPVVAKLKELGKKCVVCSMPDAMSGDLSRFVGEGNVIDPMALMKDSFDRVKERGGKDENMIDRVGEARQKMIDIAIAMKNKYTDNDVWVSPFLRVVSQKLPHMARKELREVMHTLGEEGLWEIKQLESDRDGIESYSVLILNQSHPSFMTTPLVDNI